MDINKFGETIHKQRIHLQMTQQYLADKLGVTNKAVSKWERGESFPDITLFKDIARVLEIEMIELLSAGNLMDSEDLKKEDIETTFEKGYKLLQALSIHKMIGVLYYVLMIGLTIGLIVPIVVDYSFNQQVTWSIISTAAVLGTMMLITVIRLSYTNLFRCISSSLLTTLLISIPIVASVAYYNGDLSWVVDEFIPIVLGSIIAVLLSILFYKKSRLAQNLKIHISLLILMGLVTIIQSIVLKEKWSGLGNTVGFIILLILLPQTISRQNKK